VRAALLFLGLAACGRFGFDTDTDLSHPPDAPACGALDASWTPAWSSLIEYEPFDGSGAIANNATVKAVVGDDGIAYNTAPGMAYVAGRVGQAIYFDGVDDYISIALPNVNTADGTSVTIALWLNWNGKLYTGNSGGWTKIVLFPTPEYALLLVPTGTETALGFNTNSYDAWGVSAASLGDVWVHVVAVFYNGMSNQSQLYLNGEAQQMSQALGSSNVGHADTSLLVAALPSYPSYLGGEMDELAIWNTALTAEDVATLYATQAACP
jgi:hypothetical protein